MAGWNTRISISSTMVRPYRYLSKHNRSSNNLSKPVTPATRVCYVKEYPPIIMEPQEVSKICLIRGFPLTIGSTCGTRPTISISRNMEIWTAWPVTGRRLRTPVWVTWDTHLPPTDIRPPLSSMPVANFRRLLSIIKAAFSTDRIVRRWSNRRCTIKCTAIRTCRRSNRSIRRSNRNISICRRSSNIWCTSSNSNLKPRRNRDKVECIRNNSSKLSSIKASLHHHLVNNSKARLRVQQVRIYRAHCTLGWGASLVSKIFLKNPDNVHIPMYIKTIIY